MTLWGGAGEGQSQKAACCPLEEPRELWEHEAQHKFGTR